MTNLHIGDEEGDKIIKKEDDKQAQQGPPVESVISSKQDTVMAIPTNSSSKPKPAAALASSPPWSWQWGGLPERQQKEPSNDDIGLNSARH